MENSTAAAVARHVRARSGVTNYPRRLRADCDMRTFDGRRFADIFDALTMEYPDADPLRIREVAVLKFAVEKALAVGNFEDVVRLSNSAERGETRLRLAQRKRHAAAAPDLAEYLALAKHEAAA
jgi:hypothetical protein